MTLTFPVNSGPAVSSSQNTTALMAAPTPSLPVSLLSGAAGNVVRKIKTAMAAADKSNPAINQPWNAAPAWVTGTAYGFGQMVTNGGNQYLCSNTGGGTSGATAPTGTAATNVSDGTLSWVYAGTAQSAYPAFDAPSVSISSTITGLTQTISCKNSGIVNTNQFNFVGGLPFSNTFGGVYVVSQFLGSAGNLNGQAPYSFYNAVMTRIEFLTDSPKLGIGLNGLQLTGAAPFRIEVDDRVVSPGCVVSGSTVSSSYIILDWTGAAAMGRKVRKVRVYGWGAASFQSVVTDPLSEIWPTSNPNRFRVFVDGDSLTQSSSSSGNNMTAIGSGQYWVDNFAHLIGCDDVLNGASAATGFNAFTAGTTVNYGSRLPWALTFTPDVLMIAGNHDDTAFTSQQRQAAILTYMQQARAALPNAILMVFGPWPEKSATNSNIIACDNDMAYAVSTFADPLTFYYSIINDKAGSWVYGTGSTASPAGNGNADLYVAADGVHPTQMGADVMARRYANAFKSIINGLAY